MALGLAALGDPVGHFSLGDMPTQVPAGHAQLRSLHGGSQSSEAETQKLEEPVSIDATNKRCEDFTDHAAIVPPRKCHEAFAGP